MGILNRFRIPSFVGDHGMAISPMVLFGTKSNLFHNLVARFKKSLENEVK